MAVAVCRTSKSQLSTDCSAIWYVVARHLGVHGLQCQGESPNPKGPSGPPHAACSSPSSRRTTAALVCSPVISLRYVRRCTSGLWPITAATSA